MKRKTESTAASHIETCGTLLLSFSLIGGLVLIVLGFEGSSWLLIPGIGACLLGYFTYWLMRGLAEICEEIVLIRVALEDIVYNPHSSYTPNKDTLQNSNPSDDSSQEPKKVKFHSAILDDYIEITKEQTQPKYPISPTSPGGGIFFLKTCGQTPRNMLY